MFTRVAAIELGPYGISVNSVVPGAIKVERTQAEAPACAATWSPLTPLGRFGYPFEVARSVAFLVSADPGFTTGQTLSGDGGVFSQGPWSYPIKRLRD